MKAIAILTIILTFFLNPLVVTPVGQYNEVEVRNNPLEEIAQDKLNDLLNTNYWSHTSSNGCDFNCRTLKYSNEYSWLGENLYRARKCDEKEAYRMWRESPVHNAILEHEADEEILLQGSNNEYCYLVLIKGIVK
jgi:hypothetical protein